MKQYMVIKSSSFERKIIRVILQYSLPFIYTGNFSFFIGDKNPDFKHLTKNLLIETYSKKVHQNTYEVDRSTHFSKYGYNTLFLSDEDFYRVDWITHIYQKICEFLNNSQTKDSEVLPENFSFRSFDISKTQLKHTSSGRLAERLLLLFKTNNRKVYSRSDLYILLGERICPVSLNRALRVLLSLKAISKTRFFRKVLYNVINTDIHISDIMLNTVDIFQKFNVQSDFENSMIGLGVTEIKKYLLQNNIKVFKRKDLRNLDNIFARDTLTKSLRYMVTNKILEKKGCGKYTFYSVVI